MAISVSFWSTTPATDLSGGHSLQTDCRVALGKLVSCVRCLSTFDPRCTFRVLGPHAHPRRVSKGVSMQRLRHFTEQL